MKVVKEDGCEKLYTDGRECLLIQNGAGGLWFGQAVAPVMIDHAGAAELIKRLEAWRATGSLELPQRV